MKDSILIATSNLHKLWEIGNILKVRVKPLDGARGKGQVPRHRAKSRCSGQGSRVIEDGKTFEENAIKKAKSIKLKPGQIAIADDSGLMVECLDGKPGIRSARFASPPTAENLCRKLLRLMKRCQGIEGSRDHGRKAKFVCVIAIVCSNGKVKTVRGVCRGKITHEMHGEHGFGYDPVFVPDGYRKTFAEMSPAFKNRISHRAKALKRLASMLQSSPRR